MSEKLDIMQALLDLQLKAGEWFDAIEADSLEINLDRIAELVDLIDRLCAVRDNMIQELALDRARSAVQDYARSIVGGLDEKYGHSRPRRR